MELLFLVQETILDKTYIVCHYVRRRKKKWKKSFIKILFPLGQSQLGLRGYHPSQETF